MTEFNTFPEDPKDNKGFWSSFFINLAIMNNAQVAGMHYIGVPNEEFQQLPELVSSHNAHCLLAEKTITKRELLTASVRRLIGYGEFSDESLSNLAHGKPTR